MLIEFRVENFLSFKDEVHFSMRSSSIKEHQDTHAFKAGKHNLLKSAVLYGANASGKSNLIQAMMFMKSFVISSSKDTQVNEAIDVTAFLLHTETENAPSRFEITFYKDEVTYRYGFTIDRARIREEWLYRTKVKEVTLFYRHGDEIEVHSSFAEGKGLEKKTRPNALFLSVNAQFNGEVSTSILDWFVDFNAVSDLYDFYREYSAKRLHDVIDKQNILQFLKASDLGIEDVQASELQEDHLPRHLPDELKSLVLASKQLYIQTQHRKYDATGNIVAYELFDLNHQESEGTKKLFALSGILVETLQNGEVLIIDELDAKLHTLLVRFIVSLFHSKESNPNNAQLIFSTHDTNVFSNRFFRRDQIWLTEKDRYGSTDLYSLVEYELDEGKVRNDATFGKDYIMGKYGAIPFIGDFTLLLAGESDDGDR